MVLLVQLNIVVLYGLPSITVRLLRHYIPTQINDDLELKSEKLTLAKFLGEKKKMKISPQAQLPTMNHVNTTEHHHYALTFLFLATGAPLDVLAPTMPAKLDSLGRLDNGAPDLMYSATMNAISKD